MSTTLTTTIAAPSHAPTGSDRVPDYRLTRRGRTVVLSLAVLVALAVMVLVAGGSVATSTEGTDVPTRAVLVAPGDTLWDIASGATEGDVRAMMVRIEQLNGLDGGQVAAGERIFVPVG